MNDLKDHTNEELVRLWNFLETQKLSPHVEARMSAIDAELKTRGVIAWNDKGEITEWDERNN
jgi:hypothetical protein